MSELHRSRQIENGKRLSAPQTAALMVCLTLISKGFGFVRELIYAGSFGTSYIADAFTMAQGIPGVLLGGILGGVSTAYMPMLSDFTEHQGKQAGNRFTSQILSLIFCIAAVGAVFGIIFAPQVIHLFAPKFDEKTATLTAYYLRIFFPFMFLSGAISTVEGYLRYHNHFLSPIIAGYFYNAGAIALIFFSAHIGYRYLAFSVATGYFLQLLFLFIVTSRNGYRFQAGLPDRERLGQILRLGFPVAAGAIISQMNNFVDKILASGLPAGSISSLSYGALLSGEIASLTTVIIATIFYPKIVRAASLGDWDYYNEASERSMTVSIMIAIPFSLGAIIFSEQVVQVIYERSAFDSTSTSLTVGAFRFYSLGIAFSVVATLLSHMFNSLRDTRMPVICGTIGIVCNIVLNLILIGSLQHRGLALATSVASAVNCTTQFSLMKKRHGELRFFPSAGKVLRIVLSSVLAVGAAVAVYRLLQFIWLPRMVYLGLSVVVAVAVYFLLLILLGVHEILILTNLLKEGQKNE